MPDYFKMLGYKTHMIGKWHLGFCNEEYLPTRRGFDSFYGMYTGSTDFYKHSRASANNQGKPGYDFRRNDDVDFSAAGKYSSYLFLNESMDVINHHASTFRDEPFFMYLPLQDVHDPLQVPDKYTKLYPNVKDRNRKIYSGKVTALDDVVGGLVKTLRNTGLLNNTIIIFTSDNGGQVLAGGNNYPYRGNKATLWEGGTKAVGFVYWEKLKNSGQIFKGLMHVTDWIPTLMSAIMGPAQSKALIRGKLDGADVWNSLISNKETPRKEMLYNIDPFFGDNKFGSGNRTKSAAIRVGNMKLILGDPGLPDGWIPPAKTLRPNEIKDMKNNEAFKDSVLIRNQKVRLYNLLDDPYEEVNLVSEKPEVTKKLMQRLSWYESTMIPPDVAPEIPAGNPNRFGGVWSTGWCESRP